MIWISHAVQALRCKMGKHILVATPAPEGYFEGGLFGPVRCLACGYEFKGFRKPLWKGEQDGGGEEEKDTGQASA